MHLLAIRFSAMGDVALTVPVLRGVLSANQDLRITIVTNGQFAPMFYNIERLNFHGVDLRNHRGAIGLIKLYHQLKSMEDWDAIIDLHSVMRTWVISALFKASGKKVFKIDKGRQEKQALVRKKDKVFQQLTHSAQRYLNVFGQAGIHGSLAPGDVIQVNIEARNKLDRYLNGNGLVKDKKWLGLAPFSKHKQKTWPFGKVNSLIAELDQSGDYQIFLLGSLAEAEDLGNLSVMYKSCWNMAGVLSLAEEIALIHQLDVVVAMDSFNMHLAALCNTKVVSIWGGTHSFAGFGPLNDNDQNIVQIPQTELGCRPCSVFGSKTCYRGDWACLRDIAVEQVLAKLKA